jgi:hypothetical protein
MRDRDHFKSTTVPDVITNSGALIPNENRSMTTSYKPPRRNNTEKIELENRLRDRVLQTWRMMENVQSGMEEGRLEDVEKWMVLAKGLIDEFRSVRGLFPSEKAKRIRWFDEDNESVNGGNRKGKKPETTDIEVRVEELQHRLQGFTGISHVMMLTLDPELDERAEVDLAKQQFRGLNFEQWFFIFIQVSFLLVIDTVRSPLDTILDNPRN